MPKKSITPAVDPDKALMQVIFSKISKKNELEASLYTKLQQCECLAALLQEELPGLTELISSWPHGSLHFHKQFFSTKVNLIS